MAASKQRKSQPGLKLLGGGPSAFPEAPSAGILETFPNRATSRAYWIRFDCDDFTSLCPVTGQPDFARLVIRYVPAKRCVETKSLKFYLASFRNTRAFNEEIVNRVLDDLVSVLGPRKIVVHGAFAPRGGIALTVDASHPDGTDVSDGLCEV